MSQRGSKLHRAEVLRILDLHKDKLAERYGVTRLGIFGSLARDEATEAIDVDIVVTTKLPDLLMMVNLNEDLEKMLHSRVDFIRYRLRMNSFLKKCTDNEAFYV